MTDAVPPADELLVNEEELRDEREDAQETLIDRLRGTGVGVEDPNIVGDAGPTDVAPGRDAPGDGLFADPPVADPPAAEAAETT